MGQRGGDRDSGGGRQGGCTGRAFLSRAGPRPEARMDRQRDRPGAAQVVAKHQAGRV